MAAELYRGLCRGGGDGFAPSAGSTGPIGAVLGHQSSAWVPGEGERARRWGCPLAGPAVVPPSAGGGRGDRGDRGGLLPSGPCGPLVPAASPVPGNKAPAGALSHSWVTPSAPLQCSPSPHSLWGHRALPSLSAHLATALCSRQPYIPPCWCSWAPCPCGSWPGSQPAGSQSPSGVGSGVSGSGQRTGFDLVTCWFIQAGIFGICLPARAGTGCREGVNEAKAGSGTLLKKAGKVWQRRQRTACVKLLMGLALNRHIHPLPATPGITPGAPPSPASPPIKLHRFTARSCSHFSWQK